MKNRGTVRAGTPTRFLGIHGGIMRGAVDQWRGVGYGCVFSGGGAVQTAVEVTLAPESLPHSQKGRLTFMLSVSPGLTIGLRSDRKHHAPNRKPTHTRQLFAPTVSLVVHARKPNRLLARTPNRSPPTARQTVCHGRKPNRSPPTCKPNRSRPTCKPKRSPQTASQSVCHPVCQAVCHAVAAVHKNTTQTDDQGPG